MATTALALGGHTGTQLTRTLERVLEDAQLTGEVRLSGRKLKEFPKIASKYSLGDTVAADLSKNRFIELPVEVCEYVSMERLDCYHNVIRSIPESVICLISLTHLNLSRNQMTTLPVTLCQLPVLQVLIASNNKLVSLPEEIGRLKKLTELDVSCNELSHLPAQIDELENLRSLNLRRNLLVELPIEVTVLRLTKLDFSENRISTLPVELRLIDSLIELSLENNPLTSPPAYLCTRGRVHVFKFLDIQAIKEDKKRGIVDSECRRPGKKTNRSYSSLDSKLNGISLDSRRKRYTVDSGYNTSECGDKRWSQELPDQLANDMDDARKLALRAAELTKEQRLERERGLQLRLSQLGYNHGYNCSDISLSLNGPLSSPDTPSTLSPGADSIFEDAFTRELNRQRSEYEERKRIAERIRREQEEQCLRENKRQTSKQRTADAKTDETSNNGSRSSSSNIFTGLTKNGLESISPLPTTTTNETVTDQKPYCHVQTYREYKEALRLQRAGDNGSTYRRPVADEEASVQCPDVIPNSDTASFVRPGGALVTNHVNPQDEFRAKYDAIVHQQQYKAQMAQKRLEEKKKQKEAVLSYMKARTSPQRLSDSDQSIDSFTARSPLVNGTAPTTPKSRTSSTTSSPSPSTKSFEPVNLNFTIRREFDKAREEAELVHQLRQAIETRLKVSLPEDLSSALMDGVVLCHLANHVRPRSVASIHVPSPAVPKLTLAKCRRNVENFIDACRRIGVDEADLCSCEDVVLMRRVTPLQHTVQCLMTVVALRSRPSLSDHLMSFLCLFLFLGTCVLLYFLPPPT